MKGFYTHIFAALLILLGTELAVGQTMEEALSSHITIIVDSAGNGDYATLTAAINASKSGDVIFIRKGTYHEKVTVNRSNLTLIGEDVNNTIISYGDYSGRTPDIGTSSSHTMIVDGNDFTAINLTIENYNGDSAQAVALNFHGDKQMLLNCRVTSGQDTFYTWGAGRFYIKDSYMEGHTDFIFGRGTALFEDCLIVTRRSGSPVTAASTDENWKFGYVFQNCTFDGWTGVASVPLGRPWKPFCQVVIMNSYLGDHIATNQWNQWSGNTNHETAFYAQYNNRGPGYHPESTPSWTHILTDTEAAAYTKANILGKDVRPSPFSADWLPDAEQHELYNIVKGYSYEVNSDSLYYLALLDSMTFDGTRIFPGENSETFFTVTLDHGDTIFDANRIGVHTLDPTAAYRIVEPVPGRYPGFVSIYIQARNGSEARYTIRFDEAEAPALNLNDETDLVNIYPNPAQHFITIQSNIQSANRQFELFDLTGKKIISIQLSSDKETMDISQLSKGTYTFRLAANGKIFTGKIIK